MLTEQECLDLCELSEEEIQAIAEHEHVPEVIAAELGQCLVQTHAGQWLIRRYIMEDIAHAQVMGRGAGRRAERRARTLRGQSPDLRPASEAAEKAAAAVPPALSHLSSPPTPRRPQAGAASCRP